MGRYQEQKEAPDVVWNRWQLAEGDFIVVPGPTLPPHRWLWAKIHRSHVPSRELCLLCPCSPPTQPLAGT